MRGRTYLLFCVSMTTALLLLLSLRLLLGAADDQAPAFGSPMMDQAATLAYMAVARPDRDDLNGVDKNVITDSLTVKNVQTIKGGLTVRRGLTVTGALTVTEGLTVGKRLNVSGTLIVMGGLTVTVLEAMAVVPTQIIAGGLTVTNVQTLMGGLIVTGGLTVTGDLTVFGGLIVKDKVTVKRRLTVREYSVYLPLISRHTIIEADNGGFELGSVMWDEFSTTSLALIRSAPDLGVSPHSGYWAVRLGAYDNEVSMISQGTSISKDTSCLVYWQWVASNDACNADYGGVGVNGKWVDVHSLCAGTATARWVRQQISMTKYSIGVTTTPTVLNFAVTNDYSVPSTMYVDDVSFQSTTLCAKPKQNSAPTVVGTTDAAVMLVGQPITTPVAPTEK